jgi:hypothetical protein
MPWPMCATSTPTARPCCARTTNERVSDAAQYGGHRCRYWYMQALSQRPERWQHLAGRLVCRVSVLLLSKACAKACSRKGIKWHCNVYFSLLHLDSLFCTPVLGLLHSVPLDRAGAHGLNGEFAGGSLRAAVQVGATQSTTPWAGSVQLGPSSVASRQLCAAG